MRVSSAPALLLVAACATEPPPPSNTGLTVPAGFAIATFAEDLNGVRFMAVGPGGQVYATQTGSGRVVRLPDENGDGVADEIVTVARGLDNPHGLAFRGETLYVAESNRVIRFDREGASPAVVVPDIPGGGGHFTRTIVFRNNELYVSVGSSCNLCDESDPRRAAVVRYNVDGSGETLFATGVRNAVGLAVHPVTGAIWATNNDRDNLGDHRPPDRVNILTQGGWYGWPQCYLPNEPNPEYAAEAARCADALGPAAPLPAHVAPLGIAFYTGTMFPDEYRGNAFVALHGSWNSSVPVGYKVVRIAVQNGQPSGDWQDFATGWLGNGGNVAGRPVDVLVASDGALLISDDEAGRIYRVSR